MRLWRRNEAPVGGWYYTIEHTDSPLDGKRVPIGGFATGLDKLYDATVTYMESNGVSPPDYLFELIEDQICLRQPEDRCRFTGGLGDIISYGIGIASGAIDSIAGTALKQRGKKCGGCGKRRAKLNRLSR